MAQIRKHAFSIYKQITKISLARAVYPSGIPCVWVCAYTIKLLQGFSFRNNNVSWLRKTLAKNER